MERKVKETTRQVLALILAAAMCVSLLPSTVLAAGDETAEESYGVEAAEETDGENEAVSEEGSAEADDAEKSGEVKVLSETEAGKSDEETPEGEPEEDDTTGGDSVVKLYAGFGYEGGQDDDIKTLDSEEPGHGEHELEDDATVSVKVYVQNEDGSWSEFDPNATYSRDTVFAFDLVYDANELDLEDDEKYQLPDGLLITSSESGTIYDSLGKIAGMYYIEYDEEAGHWYVYFEYDSDWEADEANHGLDVEGWFVFAATLDEEYINNEGSWTLPFPGYGDIVINLEDGKVTGTKTGVANADGTITFTITFDVTGQDAAVSLEDTLGDNLSFVQGSFTLDGDNVSDQVTTNGNTASATFSDLTIGTHTFTYTVKLGENYSSDTADNSVDYTWKTSDDGEPHEGHIDGSVNIQKSSLSKTGNAALDNDGNLILTWTITVTPGLFESVLGTTVTDTFEKGQTYVEGSLSVKGGEGYWKEVTNGTFEAGENGFTYTFPESYELWGVTYDNDTELGVSYQITYQTMIAADDLPDNLTTYKNYVEDDFDDEAEGSVDYEPGKVGREYDLVSKSGVLTGEDGDIFTVEWTITIDPTIVNDSDTLDNLTITDQLLEGWTPGSNIRYTGTVTVTNEDNSEFTDYEVTWWVDNGNWGYTQVDDPTKADEFRLTFTSIPEQKVTITYEVEYDFTGYDSYPEMENTVTSDYEINGYPREETDSATVLPQSKNYIQKEGSLDGKTAIWQLYVNYEPGEMGWGNGFAEQLTNGVYTVTDILPEGMTLVDDSVSWEIVGEYWNNPEISYEYDKDTRTITFTIDLSEDKVGIVGDWQAYFIFTYQTEIEGDLEEGDTYTNNATYKKGNESLGETQAEVTVEKVEINKEAYVVSEDEGLNQIEYVINVNYNADNLDPTSDYLTLTDTLDNNVTLLVDTVSVKLMYPENGSYDVDYSVSYTLTEDGRGQLEITIPDSTAVVVSYTVHVNGEAGETVSVSNHATLIWEGGFADDSVVDFEIQESYAGITTQSGDFLIYKIDSENITTRLAGAEFGLYYVGKAEDIAEYVKNGETGTYVTSETTDASGQARFTGLSMDTLYYYVETKTPDGYSVDTAEKHYFILSSDTSSDDYTALIQACEEAGLDVTIATWPFSGGYTLNVPNTTIDFTKEIYEDDYARKVEAGEKMHTGENANGDGWGTWDDADNNQEVYYRMTVPDISDATNVTIHDYLEKGLDFKPESVTIDLVDGSITRTLNEGTDYIVTVTNGSCTDDENQMDGCTFEISFADAVFAGLSEDAYIVIEYTALANTSVKDYEDFVDSIDNFAYMGSGEEDHYVRSDVIKTTTQLYGFGVFKYTTGANGTENGLAGAEFTLSRAGSMDVDETTDTVYAIVKEDGGSYMITGWTSDKDKAITLTSGSDGYIYIYGLDDDTYTLTETKAPEGFELLNDSITVVIAEGGEVSVDGNSEEGKVSAVEKTVKVANDTYGFDLDKVDEEGETLEGAKFTLTKGGETVYFLYDEGTKTYTVCEAGTEGATTEIEAGSVHVTGLAEGDYTLTETEAPEGYQASGKTVTITVGENGVTFLGRIRSIWNSIISFFGADVDEPVVIADDDGNIEFTNYKLKKISVNKVWDDEGNENKRPDNIEISLMADGSPALDENGQPIKATLNESNSWSATFEDLPAVDGNDKEISYTIEEVSVEGYETTIGTLTKEDDGSYSITITNKYTIPDTVDVEGSKTWNDNENENDLRPESITVSLLADGEPALDDSGNAITATVTATDNWAWSFTDLPKYTDDGHEIEYTITEAVVSGYETTVDGYDVTNTLLRDIKVIKEWDDADNQDGLRPNDIIVNLLGDDKVVDTATLDESNGWSHIFTGLPVYDESGKEIEYTVNENSVHGYTESSGELTLNEETGVYSITLTNEHQPEYVDIEGEKTWNDNNDENEKRPTDITIQLLADGVVIETKTVTEADNWAWRFTNLPKYKDGVEIVYTIAEVAVDGYETEVHGYDVINSYRDDKTSLNVNKLWEDEDDEDGFRPDKITVHLLADGQIIETVELSDDNDWAHSFTDLPKYDENGNEIVYTITEDAVDGYETQIRQVGDTTTYIIENKHQPEKVNINGTKDWDDNNNQDGIRPAYIIIRLYEVDEEGDLVEIAHTTTTAVDDWNWSFTDLPKYKDGVEIQYKISEDAVDGYETTLTEGTDDEGHAINKYTNKHDTEKIDLEGTKTWDDDDDRDGKRPESITIHLFADGVEIDSVEVTKDDGWAWSFTGLDKYANGKEIEYTITEDVVEDYTTEINDMDVINGYIPDKVSVEGQKTWDDNDDQDGKRPTSITIRLYADGDEIDSQTITDGSNGWSWSFTDLPKYRDGGVEIVYTITEDVVTDYETEYVDDSYDVINNYKPETIEVSGLKTWEDNDNQDNVRPSSITISLLADGEPAVDADGNEVEPAVITEADGWEYSFGNLPKYKDGVEIVYTIVEDSIDDYTTIIDGYNVINYHRPGETGLNVHKMWSDNDDQDGIRPTEITIHLMKEDGDELVPVTDDEGKEITAVLDDSNNWAWSIDGLPEYADGEKIVYTVTEDVPEGYKANIVQISGTTTIIIDNEHQPDEVKLEGEKTWDDNDDQDGIRPDYITIHLLADGQEIYHYNVTADEGWKWSFTGLDKYKDGGEEIEYTVVEEPIYGYELDEENSSRTVDEDGNITYVLENDHIAEKTSASIKKVFDDANNQDGIRPETVTVRLMADGEPALDEQGNEITFTLSEGNNWSASTDKILDVYRDQGTKIEYTFEEVYTTEGYEFTIAEDGENSYEYTATNKHIPETIDISGVKEWSDDSNANGRRPVSITVSLYVVEEGITDPIKIAEQTITGAVDNWRFSFTDLPKYKEGEEGVEIVYTVGEELVDGYDCEVRQNDDGTFTIINTEPQITKELQEDDYERKDEDGEVDVPHDDENGHFEENIEGDGWGSWDDADNKQEVTYHVILDDIRNAVNLTVHDYLEDGLDFEPDTVEIELVDGDISRTLVAGTDYTETEGACNDPNGCAMAGCTFEVHFADELFEDISEDAYLVITYKALTDTHEEDYDDYVDVILNFSYMTFGTMSYRSQIVTTETELFGFGVFKYTDADGDEVSVAGAEFVLSQMRGESLMYAGFDEEVDEETGETYYMVNGWYDHIEDAEILTTGKDGYIRIDGLDDDTYTLTEVSAPAGYQTLTQSIKVTIDEDGNVTFDGAAVNKEESLPHVGYVSNESVTPKFTKEIFEDDYSRKDTDVEHGNYNENVIGDGWGTWDDADNDQVVNYRLTLSDIKGASKVTVHDYLEPGLDFVPDSVVVALYNSGDTTGIVLDDGYTVTTDGCTDPESTMNGCTFEVAFEDSVFTDLNEDAYLVIYFNALTNTDADDYTNYKDEILNHAYMTYGNDFTRRSDVVTTETDLFGFAVYKYATEDGNEVALSGAEFALQRQDSKYAIFSVGQDANLDVTCYMVSGWADSIDEAGTLTSGADGLIRILGLDDDSYTLVETKAPAGYDIMDEEIEVVIDENGNVTVSGDTGSKEVVIGKEVNVENQPKLVDIEVLKDWEDNNDQDAERPEKITIRLYANGKPALDANGDEIVVTITPDDNGDWSYKFTDLPEYENGEKITYTVIEDSITDYTPSYSQEETEVEDGNDQIVWTITNEHTPGQTSLYVYKLWTDGDDQDGIRPPDITVSLLADGESAKDVDGNEVPDGVLSETNGWEYGFTNLPEKTDGEPIDYTIEEAVPDGYEATITYVDHSDVVIIDNTHTPDTVDVKGEKTWDDADDQDGKRPDYITIRLYADGVEINHVTVTEEDGWSWSFTDLPKNEAVLDNEGNVIDHQEIVYSITEDVVKADGYTSTVNGYDVINSYIPEKTQVSGEKIWEDYENQYNTRPESITVNLYADGEKADTLEVKPDDSGSWSWSFTDLDKYRDHGTEIEYTVTETVVPDYNTKVVRNADGDYEITNTLIEPKITKEIAEDDYERKDDDIVHDDDYGHFEENVEGDSWGTWDDADNNQEVTYRLTLTDIRNAMNLTVHDYLEDGLDFEPDTVDIELYDGDVETMLVEGTDYTLTQGRCSDPECAMDGCTFEIAFEDDVFKDISDEAYLVITYKALADTSAEDYEDYEDDILNHSYLTYGSNVTLRSAVVSTETDLFGFGVYKYTDMDGEAVPLEGAEFALEKDGQYATVTTDTDEDGSSYYMIEGWVDELSDDTTLVSGEDGYIRIEGLDDDTYTLTETKAPAGFYKLAEAVTIVIDEDGNVTFDGDAVSKDNELPHVGLVENKPVTPNMTKEIFEDDYSRKDDNVAHGDYKENVEGDGWGTWDDADNNQRVQYRMTVTDIKDAVGMTVHDYLEDGLTLDADTLEVKLYEPLEGADTVATTLTDGNEYTLTVGKSCTDPECAMKGCTFEIRFEDSTFTGISEDAYLVISYQALADTNADDYEDYKDAILNHAYMTYGPEGYVRRTSPVTTETDLFGLGVYKYAMEDGEEVALEDAEFALQRADGKYAAFKMDGSDYMVTGFADEMGEDTILTSDEDGMIRVLGLDDDSYTLIETKAPAGYEIEYESIAVVIGENGAVRVDGSTGQKENAVGHVVNVENKEATTTTKENPNPTSGNGGNGGSGAPKTGDTNNMALWILLLAASAGACGTGVYMKKRKNKAK